MAQPGADEKLVGVIPMRLKKVSSPGNSESEGGSGVQYVIAEDRHGDHPVGPMRDREDCKARGQASDKVRANIAEKHSSVRKVVGQKAGARAGKRQGYQSQVSLIQEEELSCENHRKQHAMKPCDAVDPIHKIEGVHHVDQERDGQRSKASTRSGSATYDQDDGHSSDELKEESQYWTESSSIIKKSNDAQRNHDRDQRERGPAAPAKHEKRGHD